MQLVERHIMVNRPDLEQICIKAKELYNQALYYYRQSIFGNIQYFTEYELTGLFAEYKEAVYRNLPAQTAQQVVKILFKNAKSWQKARKDYEKHPYKYQSRPRLPKYKKEQFVAVFTKQQIKLKNGEIHFPKGVVLPISTKVTNIQQVRIIPKATCHVIEVVYEKKEKSLLSFNDKAMGIDLGLNNLVTCVCTTGDSFIINGKPLKAINHFYNKRISKIKSTLKEKVYNSCRIERLTFRRNQKINDYVHKASRFIVDKANELDVTKIVIGNNKKWKYRINLRTETNKQFTSIPHSHLINKIEYKAKMAGIEVITTEESYTSKCSSYDLEPVQKHQTYMGKRTKRGLFRTAMNKYINADANGAVNILRKVTEDTVLRHIDSVRSAVVAPFKFHNFKKELLKSRTLP